MLNCQALFFLRGITWTPCTNSLLLPSLIHAKNDKQMQRQQQAVYHRKWTIHRKYRHLLYLLYSYDYGVSFKI